MSWRFLRAKIQTENFTRLQKKNGKVADSAFEVHTGSDRYLTYTNRRDENLSR